MNRPRALGQGYVRWVIVSAVLASAAIAAVMALRFLRPEVIVTEVVDGPVVEAFYATGTLQPAREYEIKSEVAGILRKPEPDKPFVDKGDRVAPGQVLGVVVDTQLTYLADKAKAELEERQKRAADDSPVIREFDGKIKTTQELLVIAGRELGRIQELRPSGGASQTEFDQALNRVKTLSMDLEALRTQKDAMRLQLRRELRTAEAAAKIAEWNLQQQVLRCPRDLEEARVLDRPVSVGTRLAVNDHVMWVADVRPEKLVMRAQVDEDDVTKVRPGQTVQIVLYSYAGRPFEGKVTRISDQADPERRTYEVDVAVTAPDPRFAAGMTGELAFEVQNKQGVPRVPTQAVQDGRLYAVRDGRVVATDAQVGVRALDKAEILSGLRAGERVLLSPIGEVGEGARVRERFQPFADAAAENKPKSRDIFRGGF